MATSLKSAKEIYPNAHSKEGCFWGESDYKPILDLFGEILVQVDTPDYQGESYILYRDEDGRYGYLCFGWGSCSGCDALQACKSYEDIDGLIRELSDSIVWRESAAEMLTWMREHDWQGDHMWYEKEGSEFVEKAIAFLEDIACQS